jgi:uncharacterized protein (AIM24 family)
LVTQYAPKSIAAITGIIHPTVDIAMVICFGYKYYFRGDRFVVAQKGIDYDGNLSRLVSGGCGLGLFGLAGIRGNFVVFGSWIGGNSHRQRH